jgi:hypothetical protein
MKPVFAMIVLSAAALSVSVAEAVTYKVDESVPCSAFGCTGNLNAIGTFEFDTLGTFTDGDAETQISDFEITISSPRNQPTILTPANASVTVLGTITATPTAASVEFVGGAPGDSHSRQRSAFSFSWSCPLPSIPSLSEPSSPTRRMGNLNKARPLAAWPISLSLRLTATTHADTASRHVATRPWQPRCARFGWRPTRLRRSGP